MGEDLVAQLQSQDVARTTARSIVVDQSEDDQELAMRVQEDIDKVSGDVETWRSQAKEDYRYYYGNQWQDLDRMRMEQQKRPALVYNEIADKIDALSGLERLNRCDVHFVSRSPNTDLIHDAAGDLASDACSAVLDLCDGPMETSRIAKDVAIGGMGWGECYMSFEDDIDGQVVFTRHDPMEFYWDTKAQRENLEDARWVARVRPYSRSEFKKRWPDMIDMVDSAAPSYPEYQVGKYELVTPYYSRANEQANPEVGQQNAPKKSIRVIQYQWRDSETIYRIADQANPEALSELSETEYKSLTSRAELMGTPTPPAVRQEKPITKEVFVACGVVLEEPHSLPKGRSLLCCTGQWDSDKKVWYGLVRGLKDPQNVVNKSVSALVWQFVTNVKGGVIFKQGAFHDPLYAKQRWAEPDAWIEVSPTTDLGRDILQRQPSQISPAPPLLFQESKSAISRQSGINEAVEGVVQGEVSAPAMGKKIQGALAILGWFFDNLERFRKTQARTLLEFIREYWSYGQLVRVGGEGLNSKAIPLLREELPIEYDLVVDQSVKYNPNLKAQIWTDLMQIAGPLLKTPFGQMFLLRALKYSPLPTQLVAELQELAQMAGQQQKPQRGGKQDPPELQQAKVVKMHADAQKAIAMARSLDKKSGVELAKLVTDTTLRAHEMHAKREALRKQAMALQNAQQQGASPPFGTPPQQEG